jgi:hypothetical protein
MLKLDIHGGERVEIYLIIQGDIKVHGGDDARTTTAQS